MVIFFLIFQRALQRDVERVRAGGLQGEAEAGRQDGQGQPHLSGTYTLLTILVHPVLTTLVHPVLSF